MAALLETLSKVGLCTNLRNLLWFGDTDPDTFFPRCYRLSCDEEKATFIEDYRFTAALCILKMLSQLSSNPHPCVGNSLPEVHTVPQTSSGASPSSSGNAESKVARPPPLEVPEEATQLAVKAAEAFLGSVDHNDIEGSQYQLCPKLTDSEWDKLIQHFYSLAFENGQLRSSVYMCCKASDLLDEVAQHYPQLHMDGARNVWIIKPGASSRGRGIMCMDRLEPILELVSSSVVKKEGKWVIQKYIERPLLLFDTKFDIRQWFLVTDWNPLTMWMYKECYLRFSTQKYTLENLDQSIHLCNNSIQKHYSNDELRADALPDDNMWDSNTFQDHLSANGHPKLWESTIYPGMKQALIHVLQVAQDEIEHRKNSFELYGADFMLSSDYHPWLIEINCSPAMESSTSVTARLCRQVLEDTLKVVLDRREDKDCDIGGFELAYKQPKHEVPNYVGVQLCVQGYAVPKPRSYNCIRKTVSNTSDSENLGDTPASNSSPMQQVSADSEAKVVSEENRTTCSQKSKREISDSKVSSSDSKISDSSTSVPSIKSSVLTPTSPLRTGQTSLSCGTDVGRSRPGTCVSIVEINCKLSNTKLRVS